jgi:hypothetical protein
MVQNQNAPGTRSEHAGAKTNTIGANDTTNVRFTSVFSYHQQRIYNLLSDGIPRSAADITISLRMSDPRSVIRDLRHKGVPIADEWCEGVHGADSNGILFGKEGCNNDKYATERKA